MVKRSHFFQGFLVIILGILIGACAQSKPKPTVHTYPDKEKGQTQEQMVQDQAQCRDWAKQEADYDGSAGETAKKAGKGAVIGAAIGAATGAVIGAAAGAPGKGAAVGAAVGGVGGGILGGVQPNSKGQEEYDRAYAACMEGRGYIVK